MQALILNGAKKDDSSLEVIQGIIVDELTAIGCQVDSIILHNTQIAGCRGCFGCWIKTPGVCLIDDDGRNVAQKIIQSELLILLTPVTFGGYSSELKKAVDRMIPLLLPFFTKIDGKVYHKPRYKKYPRILGIGMLPQPNRESEQIFKTLVSLNAANFHSPAHAAGIVINHQTEISIREQIKSLLAETRVTK